MTTKRAKIIQETSTEETTAPTEKKTSPKETTLPLHEYGDFNGLRIVKKFNGYGLYWGFVGDTVEVVGQEGKVNAGNSAGEFSTLYYNVKFDDGDAADYSLKEIKVKYTSENPFFPSSPFLSFNNVRNFQSKFP